MPEMILLGGPAAEDKSGSTFTHDVVLIHGFGADSQSWVGTAPALFPIARVWALDLPAHGKSCSEAPASTLDALAEQIESSVFGVSDRPLHIIGHSIGGALALLLAKRRPGQVASLVLLAPVGMGQGVSEYFVNRYPQLTEIDETLTLLRTLVSNERLIPDTFASLVLAQIDQPGVREALTEMGSMVLGAEDLLAVALKSVAATALPRLVIWGEQDQINPYDSKDTDRYGGDWRVLSECGHLPHVEHRVVVNKHIINFLTELE